MTSISAVIERARAGGTYSERKRFTIARGRAIEKMRRFALADPHFYILELIQAAVANKAEYIEISLEDGDVTLAYIGGGLERDDLGNLFDYLFASKDRAEIGHLRELALGINAALLFKPSRVIVESGNGTLEGTTRLEMHGEHDAVDIGTPERPLTGTFVRIEGLRSGKLPRVLQRTLFGSPRPREFDVIDVRCLAAPVPIILNGEALFGFSAQRMPAMLGYRRAVSFDEGDLYGTLALGAPNQPAEFDLLMWGVMVQSKAHQLVADASVSGIVCFDRLRKTADHSGIVDDERMAEMWARLQPYAHQLVHGEGTRAATMLTQLDGTVVPAIEIRPLVQETTRCILVPPTTPHSEHHRGITREVSRRLGAPVFCGAESMARSLRAMSAGRLSVVSFDPDEHRDVSFYRQDEYAPPGRPWLTPVIDLEPLSTLQVMARLVGAERGRDAEDSEVMDAARRLAPSLGTGDKVRASVFTPEEVRSADALFVEVVSTGRLLWSGTLPSSNPGHVLRIELPDARASIVLGKRFTGGTESVCEALARVMAVYAAPALRQAFDRALETLADRDVVAGTTTAKLALRAAVRTCVPRLGRDAEDRPTLVLEQVGARHLDLRSLPVLCTLDGTPQTLMDVAQRMPECGGLIYGALRGMPQALEGLDTSKILSLDIEEERWLMLLFGENSYVRVDQREVLAEAGEAKVRDIALGLRGYADHPLLVETGEPAAEEETLVRMLIDRFIGRSPPAPPETWPREAWQECRRHAGRVLQRYVCELLRRGVETPVPEVFELPLFLDPDGGAYTAHGVVAGMRRPGGLPLVYGHAFGGAELGALARAAERGDASNKAPHTLAASSWLHHCLDRLGPVRVAFDFDLAHADAQADARPDAWLRSNPVVATGVQGAVGVPTEPVEHPDIAVLLPDGSRSRALASLAVEFGCVGWVQLDANVDWEQAELEDVEQAVRAACEACLEALFVDLARGEPIPQRERCETLLLEHAARHLSMMAQEDMQPAPTVTSELADRVLTMPLFDARHGEAMTGWRVVRLFCSEFAAEPTQARARVLATMGDELAPHVRAWMDRQLSESRVVVMPVISGAPVVEEGPPRPEVERLQDAVLRGLQELGSLDFVTHVWFHGDDIEGLCALEGTSLFISPKHPRATSALQLRSAGALAWLLLGTYAFINAKLGEVENHHETAFQLEVSRALRDGRLEWA